nr:tigger transposable element-derived protein 6-like [Rhipicephalus microplus]
MTQDLFTSWLCKFDKDMVAEKRWVVLILDNCTAHNVKPKLTAVNLKFSPANTTAKSQPLDQGVIATVKALYKKRICERFSLSMQQQQPLKVNLRGAIYMVVASWWQVKADTISKCFKRAGFVRNAEALEDDEQSDPSLADETLNTDVLWSCLIDSNFVTAADTFQEFVDAGESEFSVCEEASTDDAIVAAVRGSAEVATDDESDGEDDVDTTPEPDFLCRDALEYLAKVKTYCAKNSE